MPPQNLVGQTLGQYQFRELLGVGGMGAVYRAYQQLLKREVAIKIISPDLIANPVLLSRFIREAEISAQLEHPNIVPIYDFGTQNGITYVVMRLLTGGALSRRLEQRVEDARPLISLGEVAELLLQVGSALDYAHHRGVIHRDIKPANIMFDNQGKPYVVDFGIAKLTTGGTSYTQEGTALGTPNYMPPEQWRGETLTPSADQYALGVMTYQLLTGKMPFEGDSAFVLMHKHLHEEPTPLTVLRPDIPPALMLVIGRALSKEASRRFQSCTAFAQAFDSAIEGQRGQNTGMFAFKVRPKTQLQPIYAPPPYPSQTPPSPYPQPMATPPNSRNLLVWGLGLLVMMLMGVILALVVGRGGDLSDENRTQTAIAQVPTSASLIILDTPTYEPTLMPSDTATATDFPSETSTMTDTQLPSPTQITDTPTATNTMSIQQAAMATRNQVITQTVMATMLTPTPNLDATIAAEVTRLYQQDLTQTATFWTSTPTMTEMPSLTPTLTATSTDTATIIPTSTPEPTEMIIIPQEFLGVVNATETVNVHSGPGIEYQVIATLSPNTVVQVLGQTETGAWLYIVLPGDVRGWVSSELIGIEPTNTPTPEPTVTSFPTHTPTVEPTRTPAPSLIKKVCLISQGTMQNGDFNYLAFAGMTRAQETFGFETLFLESNTFDGLAEMQACIQNGGNVIISVGFIQAESALQIAQENPDVYIIGIDQFCEGDYPNNLTCMTAREDQAGFLAGVIAGLMTKTNIIGGIYGIDIRAVVRFRNGFEQGARYVNPNITILGEYTDSFTDEALGQQYAQRYLNQGADIIFGAGGMTGSGAIKYAAQQGVYVIGVDTDEFFTSFGGGSVAGAEFILTSGMKAIDAGVYQLLSALAGDSAYTFAGGNYELNVANGGIALADSHLATIPEDVLARVENVAELLKLDIVDIEGNIAIIPEDATLLFGQFDDFIYLLAYRIQEEGLYWRVSLYWFTTAEILKDLNVSVAIFGQSLILSQMDTPISIPTGTITRVDYVIGAPDAQFSPDQLGITIYNVLEFTRLPVIQNGIASPDNIVIAPLP